MVRLFSSIFAVLCGSLSGLTIQVDYRYDSNGFFADWGNPAGAAGAAQARAAVEAAAARWSRIIDEPLLAVNTVDDSLDRRFGIVHPGTGANYQISAANSRATDSLAVSGAANEYRNGYSLPADTWVLYVGGRNLGAEAARAGPMFGALNWPSVFEDEDGHLYRGFGGTSLITLGGTVSFSITKTNWHFDHTSIAPSRTSDFYSIALHEIGHGLGLALNSVPGSPSIWDQLSVGNQFRGANALAAYQNDHGTPIVGLDLQSSLDRHWKNQAYRSFIFPLGNPNLPGTVGSGQLQDLLMDPSADFTFNSNVRRLELTNVDIGSLVDVGWSIVDKDPDPIPVTVMRNTTGGIEISFPSETGASYTIQTATNFQNWLDVTPAQPSEGTTTTWADGEGGFADPHGPASSQEAKFYRVIEN